MGQLRFTINLLSHLRFISIRKLSPKCCAMLARFNQNKIKMGICILNSTLKELIISSWSVQPTPLLPFKAHKRCRWIFQNIFEAGT